VNVYPFIEAEKVERRNVKRVCELLQVSRAAYYADRRIGPSRRELEDDELTEAIRSVHEDSKGRCCVDSSWPLDERCVPRLDRVQRQRASSLKAATSRSWIGRSVAMS
jgi:hypothetical protein